MNQNNVGTTEMILLVNFESNFKILFVLNSVVLQVLMMCLYIVFVWPPCLLGWGCVCIFFKNFKRSVWKGRSLILWKGSTRIAWAGVAWFLYTYFYYRFFRRLSFPFIMISLQRKELWEKMHLYFKQENLEFLFFIF